MNLILLIMGSLLLLVMALHAIFLLLMINRAPGIISKIYSDHNTCKGIWGMVSGHTYEEVFEYNDVFPEGFDPVEAVCKIDPKHEFDDLEVGRLVKKFKENKKIYVRHVCKKCGHVIHKEDSK